MSGTSRRNTPTRYPARKVVTSVPANFEDRPGSPPPAEFRAGTAATSVFATRSLHTNCPGCGQEATVTVKTRYGRDARPSESTASCSNGCQLSATQAADLIRASIRPAR